VTGAARSSDDERWMDRALAEGARGHTAPNPHVGAVIVKDGVLVSVGHHERAGEAHAEIDALRAAGEHARGATLYCTLEPCNHHGRTPPCTDAIIAAGIRRVVIGAGDPKKHVPTSGAARLAAAGIEVTLGVREREARALIADFTMLVTARRPLVELKAAITLDGRIATRTGSSKWITGEAARTEAHRLRDRADAVMVGVSTVLADDPQLDVRHVVGRDPIRVILDTHLRTPAHARVIAHASKAPTWIAHGPSASIERRAALARADVELIESATSEDGRIALAPLLAELGRRDVMRLLVEGGGAVHGALLAAGLADRMVVFVAPVVLGDRAGRPLAEVASPPEDIAHAWRLDEVETERLGDDVCIRGNIARPDSR
jgi:diaminohydroxyphosphoribosylaminopyrimidine deaminase / 5-amino-6-(5-phosphoribosylamino)uracil reductase